MDEKIGHLLQEFRKVKLRLDRVEKQHTKDDNII